MSKLTRFKKSKKKILSVFHEAGKKAFSDQFITDLFEEKREEWNLPLRMNAEKFKQELINEAGFQIHELGFPDGKKRIFSLGDASIYEVAVALNHKAYLSHYSAISLLNLTEQIPKQIYITIEQSKKLVSNSILVQSAMDQAFRKPQRISVSEANFNGYTLRILKGKNTNNLGVNTFDRNIKATNIERTLIDAVVRPDYSGGVNEILKAYINAGSAYKVSVNKIIMYLNKLNYVYPYHQAIGFYMERSGVFKENQINMIKKIPRHFRFYLAYDMTEMDFSKDWNLYFPKGF